VHAAVEVQLAACTCNIVGSPSYSVPETKKFDLNRPNEFSFQRSMILIGSK